MKRLAGPGRQQFEGVMCPLCEDVVQRNRLETHKKEHCRARMVHCPFFEQVSGRAVGGRAVGGRPVGVLG
jgi:hypothetical protein